MLNVEPMLLLFAQFSIVFPFSFLGNLVHEKSTLAYLFVKEIMLFQVMEDGKQCIGESTNDNE